MVANPSKIQKKWRLSFAWIRCSRALLDQLSLAKKRSYLRKKWRLAFTIIYCCRVLFSLAKRRRPHQRWRMAFSTMYCLRVLISLSQEIVAKKKIQLQHAMQRSQSYTIVPITSSGLFNIDQASLTAVIKEKSLDCLRRHGGVEGVVCTLQTHEEDGIKGDVEDLCCRCQAFGSNTYRKVRVNWFYHYLLESFTDISLYIILVLASLALWLGIKKYGVKYGWHEGGYPIIFAFVVSIVTAIFDFGVEKYFKKSFKANNNDFSSLVDVVRNGLKQQIAVSEIVVGDVVHLKRGDQVPADGLLLDGQSLKVDESSLTGDNDPVEVNRDPKPFLLSGTKVIDGYAKMVVTTVGMNTLCGEKMSLPTSNHNKRTPLQARVHKLTLFIRKVNLITAFVVLAVLLARYFSGNTTYDEEDRKFIGGKTSILDVLHTVVEIVLVTETIAFTMSIDSFSWVVTISLAHSIKRMMADMVIVQKPSACETMGLVTTIVTDKMGSLTQNQLKVAEFWLGGQESIEGGASFSVAPNVLELFRQGVGINTTDYGPSTARSEYEFFGDPIEKAILSWSVLKLNLNMEELKQSCTILHAEAFNSEKQRTGVLLSKKAGNTTHVHWKGAAEMILPLCSYYYDASGIMKVLDDDERMKLERIIQDMASRSLQCIAFAHKQVTEEGQGDGSLYGRINEDCLTLLGLVGLIYPCQPGVKKVVEECLNAGVNIKMITGEDISTARATATECVILKPKQDMNSGAIVEGEEFQNNTRPDERLEKTDEICVMTRSSSYDKHLMVQCLKQKGHVVAVVDNGMNDALVFKEAYTRISMAIEGNEIAKKNADIVILDNNFASVAMILRWGRCVLNNTQKLIQFQLTANVVSLANSFIIVVSSIRTPMLDSRLAYTLVQLVWVDLVLGIFAAMALGVEQPSKELMQKPPVNWTEPLITNIMWRNIMAQSLYQIAIVQTLQFKGESIFGVTDKANDTMGFVTSIFCQVFNLFNARKLEKKNVFKGIHKNRLFMGIVVIIIVLQVLMVELFQKILDIERLDGVQWMICIGLASLSWPIDLVVKFVPVPDKPFQSYLHQRCPYLRRWSDGSPSS